MVYLCHESHPVRTPVSLHGKLQCDCSELCCTAISSEVKAQEVKQNSQTRGITTNKSQEMLKIHKVHMTRTELKR